MIIDVVPLTSKVIKKSNEDDYIRRVIDAGDLSRAARLISIDKAIDEKLPKNNDPGPYILGIGDVLDISQILNVKDQTGFTQKIAQRKLYIADDGLASVLGIGRVALAGLTQFQAEDLLYEKLVVEQINPEFEIYISGFNSKKIYIINNLITNNKENDNNIVNSNILQVAYTNRPIYLNQILGNANLILPTGTDALITINREDKKFRISARSIIERTKKKIRLFPEDQIIIDPIPYRPETATIVGEVIKPRLYQLSPSERKTLSDALYSDETFDLITSDTSQIYLLRPKSEKKITAFHLDASDPSRLLLAAKMELRPNDIIYVAPQPVTNYNRALTQIFGAYSITTNPSEAAKKL